jgi:hypothetical protein
MRFIDIKDNIIIADHCGDPAAVPVPAGAIREFYSFNFPGLVGEDIRIYSGEIKKDLQTLLNEGLTSIAENEEIKDNQIIEKEKPFSLAEYKAEKKAFLSFRCYNEAEIIFPSKKQLNVIAGACEHYPAYLQGETGKANIKKFINIYQNIYHSSAVLIEAATGKEEIDLIISGIIFPTENDILKNMGV